MINKIDMMMFLLDLHKSKKDNIFYLKENIYLIPLEATLVICIGEYNFYIHMEESKCSYHISVDGHGLPKFTSFCFEYEKLYYEIKEYQKHNSTVEQLILAFGRDPFGISVLLDDIKEHTGVDFTKEVFDYISNSKL